MEEHHNNYKNLTSNQDMFTDPLRNSQTKSFEIPSWDNLQKKYDQKWLEEKEKFQEKLTDNFRALTEQYRSGPQEIYQLPVTAITERYERAFRELFSDTGYQASVGEVDRTSGAKKFKRLSITLPPSI